jgi:hypothetical protein
MTDEQRFYRVQLSANHEACTQCGHGSFYTIVYKDVEEDIEIGTAWGDSDVAEDVCALMNMAYDAGQESQIDNAEEEKLVKFFRGEGDSLGNDGDHDNLSPAETAIRAMRRLITMRVSSR